MRYLLLLILLIIPGAFLEAQFSISGHQPACFDSCNGTAQVTTPTGNFHFVWSSGDTVRAVSGLCAGPYQCIISDSLYQVLDTLRIVLSQPGQVAIIPGFIKNHVCNGDTLGFAILNVLGGTGTRFSFNWSNGYQGYLSSNDKFALAAGNYSITVADINGCSASTTLSISQPAPITITPQVTNTSNCQSCNGAVTVSVSGGNSLNYTYSWSNGSTTAAISNLCAGGYSIMARDTSGCSATARVNVVPATGALNVAFSTITNIDCTHQTGFLFASPTGGTSPYHYNWSTSSTAPDIFNLPVGAYTVSVTDSNGCFGFATDTIKNVGLLINTILRQDFICDRNTGKITIAPAQGTAPYTLHWSNGATTNTINSLRPGTYTVTVTDHAGCSVTAGYSIAQKNTSLTAQTSVTNITCKNINGSASVSLHGGLAPYSYLWYTSPFQTTDTATNVPAGTYQLRVIDAFGCTLFTSAGIQDNSNTVTATASIANCDTTGSATASLNIGTAPYSYAWNTVPTQTNATAVNLSAGNYIVSVTDSTGCVRTGAVTISYSCVGLVTGTIFYDANANCTKDNGELGVAGIPVYAVNGNVSFEGTTNLSGSYSIPVTATGGYKIILGVGASSTILQYGNNACGYMEACPSNDSITFVTLKDTFQNFNFGFTGSNDFDMAINTGWTPVNANQTKEYWVLYSNQAFITPYTGNATITMRYDSNLTFQSGIPTPVNNVATRTLTWIVDSIPSPGFVWADRVRAFFTVPPELPATFELKNDFHIDPVTGDCDTSNNSIYSTQISGLSPRAVAKEVNPGGDLMPGDSLLTYTIYFQNPGTDTARVIKITDSLSPYLDPLSVQNIASSPLYNQFYIGPGVVLTWVFNPAQIPGSEVNSLTSTGFVSFTAKLKNGTRPGYTIKNYATVFIDNHAPVNTDTTHNFIAYPASVIELTNAPVMVRVFPNPFNSETNIMVEGLNDKYDFELMDITGRIVKKISSVTTNQFQLERSGLSAGVYIYNISTRHKTVACGKIAIQ